MGFLSKLNRLIELYLIAVKTFMRGGVWIPFIIYGVLQYAILIVLTNYTNPFIYPILLPVVNLLLDENAVMFEHYPTIYLMLPYLFQWFKIALGLIFEGLAVGLTVVLAIKILNIRGFGVLKLSFARNRWLYLALAWTLITALLWALNRYLPVLFTDLLDSSPRRQMAFDFAMRLLTVGFYSIFIYVLPALIVYKNSFITAFKTSFSFFIKNPIFSFFLALIPILLTWPISFITSKANVIIEKFSPELILYLLSIGIFIDFIVNCLITIAVAKFLIDESE